MATTQKQITAETHVDLKALESLLLKLDNENTKLLQSELEEAYRNENSSLIQNLITLSIHHKKIQFLEYILRLASQKGDLKNIQIILEENKAKLIGIDVNARGQGSGRTALFWATAYGHCKIAETLLNFAADPSIPGKSFETKDVKRKEETPLSMALRHSNLDKNNGKAMVELFKKHTAAHKVKVNITQYFSGQGTISSDFREQNKIKLLKYIISLAKYMNTKPSDFIEATKNFNKFLTDWIMEIIKITNALHNSDNPINSISFQSKLKDVDGHTKLIEDFCKILQFFNLSLGSFMNNQMGGIENIIIFQIAEFIQFRRKFLESIELTRTTLESILASAQINNEKRRILKKQYKKQIFQIKEFVLGHLEELLRLIQRCMRNAIVDPAGFINFIDAYFPGGKISKLTFIGELIQKDHAANQIVSTDDVQLAKMKNSDDLNYKIIQGILGYLPELERYTLDLKTQVEKIAKENKDSFDILHTYGSKDSSFPQKTMISIFQQSLDIHLQDAITKQKDIIKNNKAYRTILFEIFNFGTLIRSSLKQMAEGGLKDFFADVTSISQNLEKAILGQNQRMSQIQIPTFEDALAEDMTFKEKQYHEEQERRAKRKLEREQKAKEADLIEKKKDHEKIKALQNTVLVEMLFRRLYPEKNNRIFIDQLIGILSHKTTTMKKKAFFVLIKQLKIKGYELIKADNESVEGNSVTLTLGQKSLTLHTRHGRDREEELDPNVIKEFRDMLGDLGFIDEKAFLNQKEIFFKKFDAKSDVSVKHSNLSQADPFLLSSGATVNAISSKENGKTNDETHASVMGMENKKEKTKAKKGKT